MAAPRGSRRIRDCPACSSMRWRSIPRRLLAAVAEAQREASGKHLPINGAGAAGAALVDVGIAPAIVRAFVLIARTAGLVAHLAEEMRAPIGKPLWLETERRASHHG